MEESEWISIGPCAAKFGIEVPRLRTWCEKGLVSFDKRSTGRWIPATEFPKIKMIKEIFERGGNVTFEDVKQELIKANLYNQLQTNKEEEQKVQEMALTMEKAFAKTGATDFFSTIATEFSSLRQEVRTVTRLIEQQNQAQEQDKKRMDKIEEDNEALRGLVQQFVNSDKDLKDTFIEFMRERELEQKKHDELVSKLDQVESQLSQTKQRKGLFYKLFGKK